MSAYKIVHIAPTPLVGAPGKIAWAQRAKGHDAIAVALSDYPRGGPLERMFLDKTLIVDDFTRPTIERCIRDADIIHVHNYLLAEQSNWLLRLNTRAAFVYQAHSPLREGPLYVDRTQECARLNFRARLVVGQYSGRFFPSFIPVPNLIIEPPSIKLRKSGEMLRVMFSPTHKNSGRWSNKHSDVLDETLTALTGLRKIEVVRPAAAVPPETLLAMRRTCHVTIDEIVTGAFHMVSLEGLCAGNVVVNRADYFAKATFSTFCDGEMPPFRYADDGSIGDVLLGLAEDPEQTVRLQQGSYDYFRRHCDPLKLVEVFDAVYKSAL